MGRHKTATSILDARGAFKKHPERKRKAEPKSDIAFPGRAPSHLTPEEKKCWREIVKIVPAGVLTGADVTTVEIVSKLLAEMREDFRGMPTARLNRLCAEIGKIGLSPSARASLEVHRPEKNTFDDV